jgi:hypothetical protein
MMLEKIQSFADGKYDLSRSDLDAIYDEAIGDTSERLESLGVVQRQVSTGSCLSPLSRLLVHPSADPLSLTFLQPR